MYPATYVIDEFCWVDECLITFDANKQSRNSNNF